MKTFAETLQKYKTSYERFDDWLDEYLSSERGNRLWNDYKSTEELISGYQIVYKFPYAMQIGLILEFLGDEGYNIYIKGKINSLEDFKVLIDQAFNELNK